MIKMIRVDKLFSHPDNPRKDLGDVTELSESIKESGVLQNLTVVPWGSNVPEWGEEEQRYTVVIGHRRLEAAKIAKLDRVPCSIVKMDKKTQVATMLLENMQRVDLTVYEQAQGFQMMIDLGETVTNISEKTGFSQSTVRRRMKLLELDQNKLKETASRGATLMEYMELSKIKDIEKRNEVLEHVGTSEFNWKFQNTIREQEREELREKLIKKVSEFAKDIQTLDSKKVKTKYIAHLSYTEASLKKNIKIEEGKEYIYQAGTWNIELWENIYGQAETDEERIKRELEERKRAEEAEKRIKIDEIKDRTTRLRREFIYSLSNSKLKPHIGDIILLAIEVTASFHLWKDDYMKIWNIDTIDTTTEDFNFKEVEKEVSGNPELSLLKIIYEDELKSETYFNWRGEYVEDEGLDKLYNLLEKLGYEMSEEEKQLQEGTHELFKKNEQVEG